ncbi:MAG: hypothetical protein WCJ62_10890 [Flavobacterium sp.]
MRKIIFILLFSNYCIQAQITKRVEQYSYGRNGIEFITKSDIGKTVFISTFNSRPTIHNEVAINVFNYFREKAPKNGDKITILVNDATVNGTFKIKIKDNLTSLEFYYETVEWKDGLTEVYINPCFNNNSITSNDD